MAFHQGAVSCRTACVGVVVCYPLVALLRFLFAPELLAAWKHGWDYAVPDRVNPFAFRTYLVDHVRRLGSTRFAREDAYGWHGSITEADRQAYFRDGYLVIRGLVPPETVVALREEIAGTLGFLSSPYNENAWFMSDALLDFLVFGPFGRVVARLLGGEGVRLVYSNHNLRRGDWPAYQAHRRWHWDSIQCCNEHYVPAHATRVANANFQIALYDDMPGMYFVNQSTVAQLLDFFGQQVNETRMLEYFLRGVLPRDVPQALLGHFGQEFFDRLAIRPRLRIGDAIAHAPTLIHRSPDGYGGRPSGWLLPTYALSEARFTPVPFVADRLCDTGEDLEKHGHAGFFKKLKTAGLQQLKESPRPACFPQVHPPADARKQMGDLKLSFRRKSYAGIGAGSRTWFWLSHLYRMERARAGPDAIALQPPVFTDTPSANVVLPPEDARKEAGET
eukprot:CAMPEP_0175241864 /NCGR_PEP_ID=MMETSP0093-20121207/30775_1 /TAXON_ID=311494 /ORGANISM="Alexandrium monilatum, Strain CCMP3105" /LENGTH=446 /DNA_ID=CAMNT_0016535927 /DNA_START=39 /DNA_END=1376 /DNA_ORIENTATION=+